MRRLTEAVAVITAAAAGLAVLARFAPAYFSRQGFPADEAWTAAVHARSLARSGALAFNPDGPGPGVASLLWSVLLAPIYLIAPDAAAAVPTTKLLGFALHVASALLLLQVLAAAGVGRGARVLGAGIVALHPDLIAGSASGMEVPLATLGGCALLWAAQVGRIWAYAGAGALLPLVRPDLAILGGVLPLLAIGRADGRLARALAVTAVTAVALAASLAVVLGRDIALGAPLIAVPSPAAFRLSIAGAEITGFRDLLGQIPATDSSMLLLLAAAAAVWRLSAVPAGADIGSRIPAAAVLSGLGFCAGVFALHPSAPSPKTGAFGLADQRYALAALPLIVGAMPAVLRDAARAWLPSRARGIASVGFAALVVASVLVHAPKRYVLLGSDARSVDELQVAAGKLLATAPPTDVIWAVHPGAIRYFGGARVVDLRGGGNPELAGSDAARFLAAHPPRYLEVVPERTELDPRSRERVKAARFESAARDLWTGRLPAEERWIVLCAEPEMSGQLAVDHRVFGFRCAPDPPGAASAR